MVGKKRLELLSLAALVPKTSAYTNSATCPIYCCFIYYRVHLSNGNNGCTYLKLNKKNDYFALYKHL